jgi:FKBP-type peptidyl-prolyl cis-trans isomerase
MNTTQVTSTGIAVALAVVIALGLLFFGPQIFSSFSPRTSDLGSSTDMQLTGDPAQQSQSMDSSLINPEPIPSELPTTLTATDVVVGTGAEATAGSQVTVNYVGMLPDGSIFDASAAHGQPFTFTLGAGQVIKGWDMGVAGMKVGGKRRLIIPSDMGYGSQGAGNVIPPNATLIFDVQLVDVK